MTCFLLIGEILFALELLTGKEKKIFSGPEVNFRPAVVFVETAGVPDDEAGGFLPKEWRNSMRGESGQ